MQDYRRRVRRETGRLTGDYRRPIFSDNGAAVFVDVTGWATYVVQRET